MRETRRDETELVVAARAGDRRALDELIAAHLPLVYTIVRRALDGRPDVDDVVQDVMIRAVRRLPSLRDPASFRLWLTSIVVRRIGTHLARTGRAGARTAALDEAADTPDAAFEGAALLRAELSGQRRAARRASRWLDPDDRALLPLWWLETAEELNRADVAAALDVSVAHAGVRVQRLRERLAASRALVAALDARPRCMRLEAALAGWDGVPGPLWRKRATRHTRDCPVCTAAARSLVPAERLFPALVLLPVPAGLAATVLAKLASGATASAAAAAGGSATVAGGTAAAAGPAAAGAAGAGAAGSMGAGGASGGQAAAAVGAGGAGGGQAAAAVGAGGAGAGHVATTATAGGTATGATGVLTVISQAVVAHPVVAALTAGVLAAGLTAGAVEVTSPGRTGADAPTAQAAPGAAAPPGAPASGGPAASGRPPASGEPAAAGVPLGPVSLESANAPGTFAAVARSEGVLAPAGPGSAEAVRTQATFEALAGLADPACVTFRFSDGRFLRHSSWRLVLHIRDRTELFRGDATFCPRPGPAPGTIALESQNYPGYFLRHRGDQLWVDRSDSSDTFRADAAFLVRTPLSE
ncbi:RNA polymerase sigma factor (sigma-70 family) [Catenuloplanes nepalensis]|uniref:RNA polymerase sigma factor (Sigma-70 family) n=1 Tax=Catenuloplanes nepalensis TaxID=587533 RepID=A0ABT9MR74_9ACTN|nr:sigma-70 family RNA polymerase sigma factor [Catenuloplanes nepalensis]MDP9793888.1 RNA polymerase sigma factor (sigma-70 family) [Catenuloplanes nepalensis]